ncbi:hypothetical protein E8E13_003755 [Curvularia kusanoi]|uniref:Zn(2)-C6 fungal-type domain-containing protein n=1 Tax=Curvularia kusanoi TaxID=90978 RepID=A0A9P4T783_CURKU|nr:hypothetical protein E8E13_003755 [Curvularia kusanoi]
MGSEDLPRASLDFAESSVLEAIAPAASKVDIEAAFNSWDGTVEEEGASILPFVKQRNVLLFDELLSICVVFRTPLLEDDTLKSYLDRLAVNLDVYAFGTAPGPDQEAKALPKELIYSETIKDTNEPTIVLHQSDDAKHAYVIWKVQVPIARPQGRFHKPAIYFQPTASLKPDIAAKQNESHDDYLPSRVPPALNLLQSFDNDPALAGIHPRLSAMRISKIAPSAPLAREMARPIKTGQRPLFRVVPPLMWRTRFSKVHTSVSDLSLMASLDIEVASYTPYAVKIKRVNMALAGGEMKPLTHVDTSTSYSPGDLLSYLYKATPDLDSSGTPLLGSTGHVLTLNIEADILVADDCIPHVAIQWKTAVDFASEQQTGLIKAAHRLSSASHAGSIKSPSSSSTTPATDAAQEQSAAPSNAINVTLTISGPSRITVGEPFHWDVFIVNRSDKLRRLAIMVIPKRKRDAHRPTSSASSIGGHGFENKELLAPAVLDENVVYGRQKGAKTEATELVCLTTDIRLGQLSPGSCYTAELKFVALAAGVQTVDPRRGSIPEGSDTMSPQNDPGASIKRKGDEGAPQPRAKRNRYISIACNECKRRKIKCNGQTPCQRCGNLNLECLYAPNCCNNFKESDEFKQMTAHITSLQQQVDDLFHNLASLRTHVDTQSNNGSIGTPFTQQEYPPMLPPPPSVRSRTKSFTKHPRFQGPTANAFNLGVARSSLKTMGITAAEEAEDEGVVTNGPTPRDSPPFPGQMVPAAPMHADKDPIWSISKKEALRMIHVWYEEQGAMYPFLDIDKVLRYAEMLFTFVEAAARSGLMQGAMPGADGIYDDQTNILKLILAITLLMESGGKDALSEKLFENVQKVAERSLMEPVSLHSISLLALTGMYYFTRDDEGLAWRMSGVASRQCVELGLHRRETYATLFPDPEEQSLAIRVFWSVYVLDRRWSLGTGMPFALQDTDLDDNLPKPDVSTNTATSYLNAMISYSAIGSKVWKSVASTSENASPSDLKISKEDISFLDFQVLNWHRTIPDHLKFKHPDSMRNTPSSDPPPRVLHRLQILLYLRANQMRILIYRPVLHTATTILSHLDFAHTVVKVAKDTIRILTFVNRTTDIYSAQQTMFNYFLISGLAVLFLAVAHAPAEFSATCRDEFYNALDLVRGLSANSYVSKRLWRTVRTLKEVGPRLGLVSQEQLQGMHDREQSSAAVAMAGLAGHSVDEMALHGYHGTAGAAGAAGTGPGQRPNAPLSNTADPHHAQQMLDTPHGMALDLTTLFEAAGGTFNLNGFDGLGGAAALGPNGEHPAYGHGAAGAGGGVAPTSNGLPAFGTENDELARIMKDLF